MRLATRRRLARLAQKNDPEVVVRVNGKVVRHVTEVTWSGAGGESGWFTPPPTEPDTTSWVNVQVTAVKP